jgi:Mrp family chromosome partitioning ATPase
MDTKGWRILGITSPSPQCGKTLTSVNLALSIARQPDYSAVVVDADMQRPKLANTVGVIPSGGGLLAVLEGRGTLQSELIPVRAGAERITVLPTATTTRSSELLGSAAMPTFLQNLRKLYPSHFILIDLPPLLTGSDVIAVLPQLDCVLLVAAVGQSKRSEVEECKRHLQSTELLRLVVNKSTDASDHPYYYY